MQVEFLGEDGVDTGGVTQEFFRLIGYHTATKYMESTGCFKHNSLALQVNIFRYIIMVVVLYITF